MLSYFCHLIVPATVTEAALEPVQINFCNLALEYPSSFRVGRNGTFASEHLKSANALRWKWHRWSGWHQHGLSVYIPSSHPLLDYEAGITGSKSSSLLVHATGDNSKIMGLRLDYSQNYWHILVRIIKFEGLQTV